jgi:hypothetical protein
MQGQCRMAAMSKPVTAEVKSVLVTGPDIPHVVELGFFSPSDPDHFGFFAQVFIGEDTDDELVDSFDIAVCSPSWFAEQASREMWAEFQQLGAMPDAVLPGAGVWFMRRWDRAQFEEGLRVVCAEASGGPDWSIVASRIGRLIPWEFAYKYDAQINGPEGQRPPDQEKD